MSTPEAKPRTALLLGLPNSGKTSLFSRLTGRYAIAANAPLTTFELESARLYVGDQVYDVIDAPGFSDLFTALAQPGPLRDALVLHTPDQLIVCLDLNRLKQSLALLLDIAGLGLPAVTVVTMVDEANARGFSLDVAGLADRLGVPVVEARAGSDDAAVLALSLAEARPLSPIDLRPGAGLESALEAVAAVLPPACPFPAAAARHVLAGGDGNVFCPLAPDVGARLAEGASKAAAALPGDPLALWANLANAWIDATCRELTRRRAGEGNDVLQTFAKMTRSLLYGPLILIVILYATFILVVDVANTFAEWLNQCVWLPVHDALSGVLPPGFWTEFLIGDYGLLSMGLANALLTVLPILSVFYLVFNTLEDVGYLPNVSLLTRRLLGRLGLGGGAIMPLVLGFGCKTMATLTARGIASPRERFITIFLIAFAIPCAGQMGLNMSIIGRMGMGAFVISSAVLIAVELSAGVVLNAFLKKAEVREEFLMELPPIRLPGVRAVLRKTVFRLHLFLKESLGVFVLAALSLFIMDKIGLLQGFRTLLGPVLQRFLGLPESMLDAIILLLARHEAAAAVIIDLIRKGELDYAQSIVAVTLTTMFIPCFANVMAIGKVLGAKDATIIFVSVNLAALASCSLLHLCLQWFEAA